MDTKVCKQCLRELPLTEFSVCRKGRLGRHSRCKECTRANEASRKDSAPRRNVMTLEERFFAHVHLGKEDACWEWHGTRHQQGYGRLKYRYRMLLAHVVAFSLFKGPIQDGMDVCHTCDNPPCCNPAHLFLGTHDDNMLDAVLKDRKSRKIPNARIASIFSMHTSGLKASEIAQSLGVSRGHVQDILVGRARKHAKKTP